MPSDFQIEAILQDGEHTRVCRAIHWRDKGAFILKSPKPGKQESRYAAQLAHELRIWEHLGMWKGNAVVLRSIDGIPTLIRPALDGVPLDVAITGLARDDLTTRLRMFLGICRALAAVHERGVIHKDINPTNLLWDGERNTTHIVDFGIATNLRDEATEAAPLSKLEGTLAYISPEQTGRMRRTIDARADLYSLGATAFEIFAGHPPFQTEDVAALVHAHLAVIPMGLADLIPGIPGSISDIVAKLLSKEPEKRYRTASGLAADVERCLRELGSENNRIEPFPLGEEDSIQVFQIPDRLYGRAEEIDRLLAGFSEVAAGTFRITLLSGYAGIGKSALVNQIQAPVLQWRAQLVSGKFDQLHRDVPYATIVQAFRRLIRQALKESDVKIAELRAELAEALGENGRILVDVIPELELIVGPQSEVPALPPSDASNRFYRTLSRFAKVFANERRPLVLFLDDLQWADHGTLEVIERLATESDITHLFLIGAFRENEEGDGHPLSSLIEKLKGSAVNLEVIAVKPLDLPTISSLLGDTLHRPPEEVRSLAEICLEKTEGNPFFLNQFLRSLHDQKLVRFEAESRLWKWDEAEIRAQHVTDNVVDLMSKRLARLESRTRSVLCLAAAIGNRFDLETLSIVARKSPAQVMDDLWSALDESFVLPQDAGYRYAGLLEDDATLTENGREVPVSFRFLHDRVQQACYAEIPEEERDALHLEIGRLILEKLSERQIQDRLFEVVQHYNAGAALLTDRGEKRRLAELNLAAGRSAKDSAAYGSARNHLEIGLRLMDGESWETDYPLCLQLHVQAVQARYLCLDYEGMERLALRTIARARGPIDLAALAEVRIQALMARNQPVQAIELALPVLRSLGVSLPTRPRPAHILAGLAATEWRLRNRPVESLLDLPEMNDPAKLAAMRILYVVFSSSYFALPKLYPLIMFEIIRLSLAYGITPSAAVGFSAYGVVQCGLLKKIDRGNRFGKLSLDLIDRFSAREIKARVIQLTQGFVTVWRTHPEAVLQDFIDGHRAGLDSGDFEFAAFTAHMRCFFLLWIGTPLKTVDEEMRRYGGIIAGLKQTTPLYQHSLWQQFAANLRGEAPNPARMIGEYYDETIMAAIHEEANDAIALFFLQCCNLVLGVLFDDEEAAVTAAGRGDAMHRGGAGLGSTTVPIFLEFAAIAWANAARRHRGRQRLRYLSKARFAIKRLGKWADCSPLMASSKLVLAAAELAAAEDRPNDAVENYHRAIDLGREHRSPLDVAFAFHRLTDFHRDRNQTSVALTYLEETCREYGRWQAHGILTHLQERYRNLDSASLFVRAGTVPALSGTSIARASSVSGSDSMIDISSVIKSAQALSVEIVLDQLLRKLMRIMMENAGADRGALVLLKDGQLVIEAQGAMDDEEIRVLQSIPLTRVGWECPPAPVDVINYVARTQDTVILEDASQIGNFTTEPYIAAHLCRSMICIPLVNQGRLVGVLELENSVTRNAFSPERVSVLQALSAQAAIAIENARLYSGLDALNRAYARFVPHEFLDILEKRSITDVRLGDQVQGTMSVLFSDIHGFTGISEGMTPTESFQFVNRYLSYMEPVFEKRGFIDKYVGDAIMGIFPGRADDAVAAALMMLKNLVSFNEDQRAIGAAPITIGIGINTGSLMLGVVGGPNRLDTTVISDSVNLSSRLEALTRIYRVPLIISEHTYRRLGTADFTDYIRKIDRVIPKGKSAEIDVYEVFAADDPMVRDLKAETSPEFEEAWREFAKGRGSQAKSRFGEILRRNPDDEVVQCYLERCEAPSHPTPSSIHQSARRVD